MSEFQDLSLEELFCRYAEDDPEVFPAIYQQVAPGLERYLKRRLKDGQAVAEVMQEVFLRLHQYRYRYNSKYLAWQWIYVVGRTEVRSFCKKQGLQAQEVEFLPELSQTASFPTNSLQGETLDLDQLKSHVDEETLLALRRKYMEEYSYREIAEELGLNESNLRQKLSRALKRLRQGLKGKIDVETEAK